MSKFTIDFFELSFLAEACIPPVPIARMTFWYDLIDKHYYTMTQDERAKLYEWMTRLNRLNDNDACNLFIARYNPNNQFIVFATYNGEHTETKAFLYNGKYHVSRSRWIDDKFINEVKHIQYGTK